MAKCGVRAGFRSVWSVTCSGTIRCFISRAILDKYNDEALLRNWEAESWRLSPGGLHQSCHKSCSVEFSLRCGKIESLNRYLPAGAVNVNLSGLSLLLCWVRNIIDPRRTASSWPCVQTVQLLFRAGLRERTIHQGFTNFQSNLLSRYWHSRIDRSASSG